MKTEIEEMRIALEIMVASNKTCDNKYNHELNKHQEHLNQHSEGIWYFNQTVARVEILEDEHYQLVADVTSMSDQLCHCHESVSRSIEMIGFHLIDCLDQGYRLTGSSHVREDHKDGKGSELKYTENEEYLTPPQEGENRLVPVDEPLPPAKLVIYAPDNEGESNIEVFESVRDGELDCQVGNV